MVIKMKKFLKSTAVITALVLLISCFSVITVSAADVAYSASSVTAEKGDTVTISVKISTSKKIWGANVMLGYNSSELQYVSSSVGDSASAGSLHNTGSSVNFSGTFKNTNGTVFTVKFKVLKESGTSTLKLSSTENIDYDGKSYTCSTVNGIVTVKEETFLEGDVDNNGEVTAMDVRYTLQFIAGTKDLDAKAQKRADVNGDGEITALDVRGILQIVAGLR